VVVVRWTGPVLLDGRLVVVAPHPDDEVLLAGGLMRWSARQGREVVVVAVTDGEASHARSHRVSPAALRARRALERVEALARLGVPEITLHRLGEPDQGCADRVADIATALHAIVEASDVVVVPSRHDRHPDHVAVSLAARCAADGSAATWCEAPTWALVHGTADPPTTTLELDTVSWAAKQHAVAAYRSQLEALGPDPEDGPVVHPHELAVLVTRREQFHATAV
jgi:LmbE family N-acetylglucosaminyl deacetylase